jgi:hypothetical protein
MLSGSAPACKRFEQYLNKFSSGAILRRTISLGRWQPWRAAGLMRHTLETKKQARRPAFL